LVKTRRGRCRARSASTPIAGPANAGSQKQKVTSAARLSEPVSVFTQIPAASDMAVSPKAETITPPR
jgi:hypothetical protein